jgi:ribonuclease P/MRP protein subunit RPP1
VLVLDHQRYSLLTSLPETRKTYRAVFSEPKVVVPEGFSLANAQSPAPAMAVLSTLADSSPSATMPSQTDATTKKRSREDSATSVNAPPAKVGVGVAKAEEGSRKKKKKARQQEPLAF